MDSHRFPQSTTLQCPFVLFAFALDWLQREPSIASVDNSERIHTRICRIRKCVGSNDPIGQRRRYVPCDRSIQRWVLTCQFLFESIRSSFVRTWSIPWRWRKSSITNWNRFDQRFSSTGTSLSYFGIATIDQRSWYSTAVWNNFSSFGQWITILTFDPIEMMKLLQARAKHDVAVFLSNKNQRRIHMGFCTGNTMAFITIQFARTNAENSDGYRSRTSLLLTHRVDWWALVIHETRRTSGNSWLDEEKSLPVLVACKRKTIRELSAGRWTYLTNSANLSGTK